MHQAHDTQTDQTSESIFKTGNQLLQSILLFITEFLELAHLEIKFSLHRALSTLGLIIFVAMLVMTSWLVLLLGISVLLHDFGLNWGYSLLAVFLFNLLLLAICLILTRSHLKDIGLTRTLRQLKSV